MKNLFFCAVMCVLTSCTVLRSHQKPSDDEDLDHRQIQQIISYWAITNMFEKTENIRILSGAEDTLASSAGVYGFLQKIIQDPDENPIVRSQAIDNISMMLEGVNPKRFQNHIRKYLLIVEDDTQLPLIRKNLIQMLAILLDRKNPEHVMPINRIAIIAGKSNHINVLLRTEAIRALGRIGRGSDAPLILAAIKGKDFYVQKAGADALQDLIHRGGIVDLAINEFGDIIRLVRNDDVKPELRQCDGSKKEKQYYAPRCAECNQGMADSSRDSPVNDRSSHSIRRENVGPELYRTARASHERY